MRRALLPALLAVVLGGCAGAAPIARQVSADPEDYHAYRTWRVTSDPEPKLAAAWTYLRGQPHGRWRSEVRAWFSRADAAYRSRARNDIARLREYLLALPDGPSSAAVADRIAELELASSFASRREARFTERAREFEERLGDAQRMRQTLLDGFSGWIARLAALSPWGARLTELDHQFIFAYRLEEPRARCDDARCVKLVSLPYALPERGKLTARRAVFDVVLATPDGRVASATLTGPQLFDRLAEASLLMPVSPGDQLARAEAIGRAVQIAAAALEPKLPAQRCAREAVSPVVLHRECDGLRVRLIAAETPDQEDRLEVEPVLP
jgi:hypothetical protein